MLTETDKQRRGVPPQLEAHATRKQNACSGTHRKRSSMLAAACGMGSCPAPVHVGLPTRQRAGAQGCADTEPRRAHVGGRRAAPRTASWQLVARDTAGPEHRNALCDPCAASPRPHHSHNRRRESTDQASHRKGAPSPSRTSGSLRCALFLLGSSGKGNAHRAGRGAHRPQRQPVTACVRAPRPRAPAHDPTTWQSGRRQGPGDNDVRGRGTL